MFDKNNSWYRNNGEGVKIVVLDSGINKTHPKLVQYKFSGYNITNNSNNIVDKLGHGTAITGIIKNHVPGAEIFMVKIFDNDYYIEFPDLCNALEYIYNNIDFHVLNLSVGLTECPDHNKLEHLCNLLSKKGIIVSAFDNFGAISYPAAYSSVIGVDGTLEYMNPLHMVTRDEIDVGSFSVTLCTWQCARTSDGDATGKSCDDCRDQQSPLLRLPYERNPPSAPEVQKMFMEQK